MTVELDVATIEKVETLLVETALWCCQVVGRTVGQQDSLLGTAKRRRSFRLGLTLKVGSEAIMGDRGGDKLVDEIHRVCLSKCRLGY